MGPTRIQIENERRQVTRPEGAGLQYFENLGGVPELWLYDRIGRDYWGEGGVEPREVREFLEAHLDAPEILVRVNSPGGDASDGFAMFNLLREFPGTVNTIIDGSAWSAASYVAMAGERVVMAQASTMMIHPAQSCACGSAADLRARAEILDKVTAVIGEVYQNERGIDAAVVAEWMANDETWFNADEALDAGLVDEIGGQASAVNWSRDILTAAREHERPASRPSRQATAAHDDSAAGRGQARTRAARRLAVDIAEAAR